MKGTCAPTMPRRKKEKTSSSFGEALRVDEAGRFVASRNFVAHLGLWLADYGNATAESTIVHAAVMTPLIRVGVEYLKGPCVKIQLFKFSPIKLRKPKRREKSSA